MTADEFFEELKDVSWINAHNYIRCELRPIKNSFEVLYYCYFCPITYVYYKKTNKIVDMTKTKEIAKKLNIEDAKLIEEAADNLNMNNEEVKKYRRKLEELCN